MDKRTQSYKDLLKAAEAICKQSNLTYTDIVKQSEWIDTNSPDPPALTD